MVAATMPAGLRVSIRFTPQAKDDYLYFSEDSGGDGYDYGTDDLLANDSAVNAARVWGIFGQSETFVQSNIGTLVSNTQPNGDSSFTVGGVDGVEVSYDAETGDIVFTFDPADFDYLADGESVDVGVFTYVIRMSNGAFSTAIAHIVINGTNDAPVITIETGDSDGATLDETDSGLKTSGTLTVTDVDTSDEVTSSVTGVQLAGDYGTLTDLDVIAMLTLDPLTPLAADGEPNNLKWSFDSGSQAFNFLAFDESLTLTYTITSDDGHGGTATHDVAIVINGTNDAPVITVGAGDDDDAELDETDAGLKTSGSLTVTDLDDSDEVTSTVTDVALSGDTGALVKADVIGMLALDPLTAIAANSGDVNNLKWNFDSGSQAFDFLAVGESLILTYTVTSEDGNGGSDAHDVIVKINGTNDGPNITVEAGDSDGKELDETDAGLGASGTLTVVDVDSSDEVSSSVTDVVLDGVAGGLTEADVLGFLKVSPESGLAADAGNANNLTWSFNSGSEAFDFLEEDEYLSLSYTITSEDGNGGSDTQTVTIKINGTAEAPVNTKPSASDDHWFISTNTTAVLALSALLGNDSDPDGDLLSLTGIRNGNAGAFTTDGSDGTVDGVIHLGTAFGSVTIDLNASTVGYLTNGTTIALDLDYEISDGNGGTDVGTLTVTPVVIIAGNKADTVDLNAAPYSADANSFSYIDAENGADSVTGGPGVDTFIGGPANDTLKGSDGADSINGAQGDDQVTGGKGDDTIDVNTNNDTVHYTSILDGTDTILNFDGEGGGSGQDVLSLDALFDSKLTPTADRALLVQTVDLGTTVEVWVNVDGGVDFELFVAKIQSADAITVGVDVLVGAL